MYQFTFRTMVISGQLVRFAGSGNIPMYREIMEEKSRALKMRRQSASVWNVKRKRIKPTMSAVMRFCEQYKDAHDKRVNNLSNYFSWGKNNADLHEMEPEHILPADVNAMQQPGAGYR